INFASPFLISIFAVPILGERISLRRWAAIALGFFGVLLITRPGFGEFHPAMLAAVGSAVFYGLYVVMTRLLSATESSSSLLLSSAAIAAVALIPVVPFVWTIPSDLLSGVLLVLTGVF